VFGFAASVGAGLDGSAAGADAGAFELLELELLPELLPPESPPEAGCEPSFSIMISRMFLTGSSSDYGREVRDVVSYARKKIPVGY
jgi:hypothetical protein